MKLLCVASCGSVGAIVVAHDIVLPLWRGHVDGCIYLPSANSRQLTCMCVYLFVCVYVLHCGYKLTKASNCAAHGLLAFDPSWSLVWNVIYLCHASPCALKTKIFIELPTILHYLMTTHSTHCLVVVLLMWLKTSSLTQAFPLVSSLLSSHLLLAVSVRQVFHCFSVFMFQVIFSSEFD